MLLLQPAQQELTARQVRNLLRRQLMLHHQVPRHLYAGLLASPAALVQLLQLQERA